MTTKRKKLQECPKCGRKTRVVRRYKDGSRNYVHATRPFHGMTEVTDACYLPASLVVELEA